MHQKNYQSNKQPIKAIELLARGVSGFPHDARLYSLYSQYVRTEADTVVPRGLAMFPKSADLLTMNAKDFPRDTLSEEGLARFDPDGFCCRMLDEDAE